MAAVAGVDALVVRGPGEAQVTVRSLEGNDEGRTNRGLLQGTKKSPYVAKSHIRSEEKKEKKAWRGVIGGGGNVPEREKNAGIKACLGKKADEKYFGHMAKRGKTRTHCVKTGTVLDPTTKQGKAPKESTRESP